MAEVIVDLGECGEILIESLDDKTSPIGDGATEKTGLTKAFRQTGEKIKAKATNLLRLPLKGIAGVFLASLPEPTENEPYELDTFSVEFNIGIKTEIGSNAGAVAKVMPEGAFKCTYTWKRKAEPISSNDSD